MAKKCDWQFIYNDPNLVEQIVLFIADFICRGKNITEINRALNEYFPGIDYILCGKLRNKAFKYIYKLADKVDKSKYIAKSIYRLERLMSNGEDKTVLQADLQLTNLLNLSEQIQTETPEDTAKQIRVELHFMDASMGGCPILKETGCCKICEDADYPYGTEGLKNEEDENVSTKTAKASNETGKMGKEGSKEADITDAEITALKIARAKRLKKDLKDLE